MAATGKTAIEKTILRVVARERFHTASVASRPPNQVPSVCVDDPVEARAIWYVALRSGAVMCPAYVARPLGPLALMQSAAWLPNRFTRWNGA